MSKIDRTDWLALLDALRTTLREVSTVPISVNEDGSGTEKNRAAFDNSLAWARSIKFNPDASDDDVWRAICLYPYYAGVTPPQQEALQNALSYIGNFREIAQRGWLESERGQQYLNDTSAYSNRKKGKLPNIIAAAVNLQSRQSLNGGRSLIDILVPQKYRSFSAEDVKAIFNNLDNELDFGRVTLFHVMMDLGIPVVKPDKMLVRTAVRLGLITHKGDALNRKQIPLTIRSDDATKLAEDDRFVWDLQNLVIDVSRETEISIREIDWLLAKMGMKATLKEGREFTVCDADPKCKLCQAHRFCSYGQKYHQQKKAA